MSFVPLCAFSLSLLEGGANGIDDTATHFAEVRAALRDFGEQKRIDWNHLWLLIKFFFSHLSLFCCFPSFPIVLLSYLQLHFLSSIPLSPNPNLSPPLSLKLWHLLLLERPFTDGDTPDSEPRLPGGRLGGLSDLGGLGGGPIGGSVPAGLGGPMGGLLGAGDHWGPGRPPRLHSQRRYRSRGSSRPDRSPAVEGWVTDQLSLHLLCLPCRLLGSFLNFAYSRE